MSHEILDVPAFAVLYKETKFKKILLDIRSPEETSEGTIPGSKLIPLPELETRLEELNKEAQIFVFCKSGPRANVAQHILKMEGFEETVVAVNGGFEQLKKLL